MRNNNLNHQNKHNNYIKKMDKKQIKMKQILLKNSIEFLYNLQKNLIMQNHLQFVEIKN